MLKLLAGIQIVIAAVSLISYFDDGGFSKLIIIAVAAPFAALFTELDKIKEKL